MSKWKLFGKSKPKKEEKTETVNELEEECIETEVIQEDKVLAEYHETLESDEYVTSKAKMASSDQRIWRDVDSIEDNIDSLHLKKATKPHTEVEKTVDMLIEKRKNSEKDTKKARKPSNVIYVVSNPQPGEVRGDWAVRGHGKIYSHHKTKENAINEARKVAKKKEATVMVQNTDGTFSEGFKPR